MQYAIRKYTSTGRKKVRDELIASYYANFRTLCKCGHSILISPKEGKKLCSHCGHWVYQDKNLEFKEKLNNARKVRGVFL